MIIYVYSYTDKYDNKHYQKIEISEEEANVQAEELATKYNMEKDEFLKTFGGLEMIQYDMEIRKVVDFLKEENK